MATRCAYKNEQGEWIYPQVYYKNHQQIAKKKLLDQLRTNQPVQEAIQIEPRIGHLIEEAKKQRCVYGYRVIDTFYGYYKPQIVRLVGWDSPHKALRGRKYYDAAYHVIHDLLPADEFDLYPEGIMPNGMFSPVPQEKYEREYP